MLKMPPPSPLFLSCGLSRCKWPLSETEEGLWLSSQAPQICIWLPCSLFHVGVHLREVVLHDVVGGAVGNGAEAERRLHGAGVGQTAILESDQVGKLLSATKGGLPFTEEILALGEKLAW